MKIEKVLGTFICVKMIEVGEKSAGGIYLPDSLKDKNKTRAVVHAVGSGYYHNGQLIPLDVKVGDKVLFAPNTAMAMMEDEEKQQFYFMQIHDVMSVISD
jgi:chaperonin GroES